MEQHSERITNLKREIKQSSWMNLFLFGAFWAVLILWTKQQFQPTYTNMTAFEYNWIMSVVVFAMAALISVYVIVTLHAQKQIEKGFNYRIRTVEYLEEWDKNGQN